MRRIRNGSSRIYELELRVSRIPARRVLHFSTALVVAAAAAAARADRNFSRCSTVLPLVLFFFFSFARHTYAEHIPFVKNVVFAIRGFSSLRIPSVSPAYSSMSPRLDCFRMRFTTRSLISLSFRRLKLECEKLATEKIEIQRHYVMVSTIIGYVVKLVVLVKCRNVSLDCLYVLFFFLSLSFFLSFSSSSFPSRAFHIQNNHARSTAKPPRLLSINCILQPRAGTELYISSLRRA